MTHIEAWDRARQLFGKRAVACRLKPGESRRCEIRLVRHTQLGCFSPAFTVLGAANTWEEAIEKALAKTGRTG
jgi:hypothetical protein